MTGGIENGSRRDDPRYDDHDDTGHPVAAFEALRDTVDGLAADPGREMATIRKGVEAA